MVRKLVKIQVLGKFCGWGGSWLEDDGDGESPTHIAAEIARPREQFMVTCLKEKKRGGGATMKVAFVSAPMASGRPSISSLINRTDVRSGALFMVRRRRKSA